jgi:hypothetical protein
VADVGQVGLLWLPLISHLSSDLPLDVSNDTLPSVRSSCLVSKTFDSVLRCPCCVHSTTRCSSCFMHDQVHPYEFLDQGAHLPNRQDSRCCYDLNRSTASPWRVDMVNPSPATEAKLSSMSEAKVLQGNGYNRQEHGRPLVQNMGAFELTHRSQLCSTKERLSSDCKSGSICPLDSDPQLEGKCKLLRDASGVSNPY